MTAVHIPWLPDGVVERRRAARTAVRMRGYVVLADHKPPLACAIRELSRIGGLLRLSEAIQLPPEFSLLIGNTDLVRCRLARRDGELAGIEFDAPLAGIA